jgi:hypothetical protein
MNRRLEASAATFALLASLKGSASDGGKPARPSFDYRPSAVVKTYDTASQTPRLGKLPVERRLTTETAELGNTDFNRFSQLLNGILTPDTATDILATTDSTKDLSKRFAVSTLPSTHSDRQVTVYGLDLSTKGEGKTGQQAPSDITLVTETDAAGNILKVRVRGKVDGTGTVMPQDHEVSLSARTRVAVAEGIAQAPAHPDHSNLNTPVPTSTSPTAEVYADKDGLAYTTYVQEDGVFYASIESMQEGAFVSESLFEPDPTEKVPAFVQGRQERVARDFDPVTADTSRAIIGLYNETPDADRKKEHFDDGKTAPYDTFTVTKHSPDGDFVYRIGTAVETDAQGDIKPNTTRSNWAEVNKDGKLLFTMSISQGEESGQGHVYALTPNLVPASTDLNYYVNAGGFHYNDRGESFQPDGDYNLLDRNKFESIQTIFGKLIQSAAAGAEKPYIPSQAELLRPPSPSLTEFSAVIHPKDTAWTMVADRVNPKWPGQEQIVAQVATDFLKVDGVHPSEIYPGAIFSLTGLTPEQKTIVNATATTTSLEEFNAVVRPTYMTELYNAGKRKPTI